MDPHRIDADGRRGLLARLTRASLVLAASILLSISVIGLLGRWWPSLDLVNHFRHATLALALAAFAVSFVVNRRTAAVLLVVCLVEGFHVVPEILARIATPLHAAEVANHTFKIVSFNMHGGTTRPEALRAFIEREAPDVLVLQEASAPVRPLVSSLSEWLAHRTDCIGRGVCHVAVLTRQRPTRGTVTLPRQSETGDGPPLVEVEIRIDGRPVTIFGTHLLRPFQTARQRRQFDVLAHRITDHASGTVLLAGDFNSAPWSYALQRFEDAVPLHRATRAVFSWPVGCLKPRLCAPAPLLPIDHIFASPELVPLGVRTGPSLGSDHLPVIAEFVFR